MNFKVIISSFKQHGFGNCTSIGVIKAAIEVFGTDTIFQKEDGTDGLQINLRNGQSLKISNEELQKATQYNGFELLEETDEKKEILNCANLCFAIIAKNKQLLEEYTNYQDAIDDLNNGESATDAPIYLGLEKYQEYVKYRDVKNHGGIIAHSVHHTVFVSHGYYDNYGTPNKLTSVFEWIRFGRKVYRLNPER